MKKELVLVANAGIARLFNGTVQGGTLQPLATLEHLPALQPPGESGAGRAGHGSADHRSGGVVFEPRLDLRHKRRAEFAVQLSARLEQAVVDGGHERLLLFASSPFLGELKARLGPHAVAALAMAIDIDLTAYTPDEVARRAATALAQHSH